jgi:hypothetical protein
MGIYEKGDYAPIMCNMCHEKLIGYCAVCDEDAYDSPICVECYNGLIR